MVFVPRSCHGSLWGRCDQWSVLLSFKIFARGEEIRHKTPRSFGREKQEKPHKQIPFLCLFVFFVAILRPRVSVTPIHRDRSTFCLDSGCPGEARPASLSSEAFAICAHSRVSTCLTSPRRGVIRRLTQIKQKGKSWIQPVSAPAIKSAKICVICGPFFVVWLRPTSRAK